MGERGVGGVRFHFQPGCRFFKGQWHSPAPLPCPFKYTDGSLKLISSRWARQMSLIWKHFSRLDRVNCNCGAWEVGKEFSQYRINNSKSIIVLWDLHSSFKVFIFFFISHIVHTLLQLLMINEPAVRCSDSMHLSMTISQVSDVLTAYAAVNDYQPAVRRTVSYQHLLMPISMQESGGH